MLYFAFLGSVKLRESPRTVQTAQTQTDYPGVCIHRFWPTLLICFCVAGTNVAPPPSSCGPCCDHEGNLPSRSSAESLPFLQGFGLAALVRWILASTSLEISFDARSLFLVNSGNSQGWWSLHETTVFRPTCLICLGSYEHLHQSSQVELPCLDGQVEC